MVIRPWVLHGPLHCSHEQPGDGGWARFEWREGDKSVHFIPAKTFSGARKGTFSKMVSKGLAITPIDTPLLKENKETEVNKRVSEESKRENVASSTGIWNVGR